ncbi:hypothetical protein HK102_004309, partial [Quaeritorhiza haematococci]
MAPICLKVKANTNDFQAFAELESGEELARTWKVCTKVKDALEHGSRLENLSWRLWHLHQVMVDSKKMNQTDFKKLQSVTTKKLEEDKSAQSLARRARRRRPPLSPISTDTNALSTSTTDPTQPAQESDLEQTTQQQEQPQPQPQPQSELEIQPLTQQEQPQPEPEQQSELETQPQPQQLQSPPPCSDEQSEDVPLPDASDAIVQQQVKTEEPFENAPDSPASDAPLYDQEFHNYAEHLFSLSPDEAVERLGADVEMSSASSNSDELQPEEQQQLEPQPEQQSEMETQSQPQQQQSPPPQPQQQQSPPPGSDQQSEDVPLPDSSNAIAQPQIIKDETLGNAPYRCPTPSEAPDSPASNAPLYDEEFHNFAEHLLTLSPDAAAAHLRADAEISSALSNSDDFIPEIDVPYNTMNFNTLLSAPDTSMGLPVGADLNSMSLFENMSSQQQQALESDMSTHNSQGLLHDWFAESLVVPTPGSPTESVPSPPAGSSYMMQDFVTSPTSPVGTVAPSPTSPASSLLVSPVTINPPTAQQSTLAPVPTPSPVATPSRERRTVGRENASGSARSAAVATPRLNVNVAPSPLRTQTQQPQRNTQRSTSDHRRSQRSQESRIQQQQQQQQQRQQQEQQQQQEEEED